MVRKSWQATVHGVARVALDFATTPPPGTAWKSRVGTARGRKPSSQAPGELAGLSPSLWSHRKMPDVQGAVILWLLRCCNIPLGSSFVFI